MAENKYWTPKQNNNDDVLAEDFNKAFKTIEEDMNGKADKEAGKGLSSNDFTDELQTKLEELPYAAELLKYMRFEHMSDSNPENEYTVNEYSDLPLPYNIKPDGANLWIDKIYSIIDESYGMLINSYTNYYGNFWQMLIINGYTYIRRGNSGNGTQGYPAEDTGWQVYKTEVRDALTSTSTTAALSANQGKILNDNKADKANVNWQLIDNAELTKNVQSVSKTLGGNYRELYIVFRVPTMNADKASGFQKARSYVYVQNNVQIYDDGGYMYEDRGNTWVLSFRISMIGNFLNLTRMFNHTARNIDDDAYASYPSNAGSTIGYVYDKKLTENYISSIKVSLYPKTTRYFPAGTTYEIWGIQA